MASERTAIIRAKRRRESVLGLTLHCVALVVPFVAALSLGVTPTTTVRWTVAVTIVVASGALFLASVRALSGQWSLVARVRAGHDLVTSGPYGRVRHPIYVATGGSLLGVLLVVGDPWTVAAATPLYLAGTVLRARAEDSVLSTEFGTRFDAYVLTVPAWLPRPRPVFARGRAVERESELGVCVTARRDS